MQGFHIVLGICKQDKIVRKHIAQTKALSQRLRSESTTKTAKNIIRNEIKSYYGDDVQNRRYGKDFVRNMQEDANSYSAGRGTSDWNKGKELVNAGCFACYYDDQRKMLSKIYGKKNVSSWSGDKVHNTYGNLIGREYSSMLRERQKKNKK
jgi:hypothetical protein